MKIENSKITKDNNEALYLCSWNSGEVIELHTEKTFLDKYKNDCGFDGEIEVLHLAYYPKIYNMTIEEFFEEPFLGVEDSCTIDNMFVSRLK